MELRLGAVNKSEGDNESENEMRPYQENGIRLGTFSKEHGNVFAGPNRAETGDDNGTKVVTIALVEGVEMIVEVD